MSTTGHSVEQGKTDVCSLEFLSSSAQKEGVEEEAPPVLTLEQQKKLWHKIDMRILPILTLMYLFSFMDRGAPSILAELSIAR